MQVRASPHLFDFFFQQPVKVYMVFGCPNTFGMLAPHVQVGICFVLPTDRMGYWGWDKAFRLVGMGNGCTMRKSFASSFPPVVSKVSVAGHFWGQTHRNSPLPIIHGSLRSGDHFELFVL